MSFKETLKLLTPLELGKIDELLAAIDAAALDNAQASADQLLAEVRPDLAAVLISGYERIYGVTPAEGDSLSMRRQRLLGRISTIGGISREYFVALAASMGYAISISEYVPAQCGVARCGDPVLIPSSLWMWTVGGLSSAGDFARCGSTACGDRLSHPSLAVEDVFNALKPAHTLINFVYA